MPTATSVSGVILINGGPLTTTFTAPASCSTAYETMVGDNTAPYALQFGSECDWVPKPECDPNRDLVESLGQAILTGSPNQDSNVVYNSPGVVCPAGWSTAGQVIKVNPTSTIASGAFNFSDSVPTAEPFFGYFQPVLDVLQAALDPGETAAVCCPRFVPFPFNAIEWRAQELTFPSSSYTAMGNGNIGCYSTIPTSEYTPKTGCQRIIPKEDMATISGTYTIGGQTFTGGIVDITGTIPLSTRKTTLSPAEATDVIGLAYTGMQILVHQSTDTSTADNPTKTNAAVRVRGNANGFGVMATVCCLAFALGAQFVV